MSSRVNCHVADSPRVRCLNARPPRADGDYVLYWMTSSRRTESNYALDHALAWARKLGKPLWVLEGLRVDHAHASERHHAFALQGMCDNQRAFASSSVGYAPFVEAHKGEGAGAVDAWARQACVVVCDDWPVYFVGRMVERTAARLEVRVEAVDSVGLVPMRLPEKCFARAHDFRRWLQRNTQSWLLSRPQVSPLTDPQIPAAGDLPACAGPAIMRTRRNLEDPIGLACRLGLPTHGGVVPDEGGTQHGRRLLKEFLDRIEGYGERNQPDAHVTSRLSPYLHWGHVSAHEVFSALIERHPQWSPLHISELCRGQREGWWGLPAATEGFLDQLITWRELGHNFAASRDDITHFESLPAWARATLEAHELDERPYLYSLKAFEAAETHDEIWNAAQRELVTTGRMQNYLRMFWGKKILHWSPTPRAALQVMMELNDRYALDGRDPNSYSGIFWVLGRYDRAWGPERPVFGKIRYMTSASTRRKLRLKKYLVRFGPTPQAELFEEQASGGGEVS